MPVAAGIVRQATLNLLLNACAATPLSGKVQLLANRTHESLSMTVTDEGPGLSPEHIDFLGRPAGQHQPADGRLGLWMTKTRLEADDVRLLEKLMLDFGGGPASVATLAVAIGKDAHIVQEQHEPYLTQIGFIRVVKDVWTLLDAAYHHLNTPGLDEVEIDF